MCQFTDYRLLCDKYNPIVSCLQETMLTMDNFVIRGFNYSNLISRDIAGGYVVECQTRREIAFLQLVYTPRNSTSESSHDIHV